jgi:regulator of replication initiation timing
MQSESLEQFLFEKLRIKRDSSELSDLLRTVAFRLTLIKSLQQNVTALRNLTDFDKPITMNDCAIQDIETSPFLKVQQDQCLFLRRAINDLEYSETSAVFGKLAGDLAEFQTTFKAKTAAALSEFGKHIERLEENLGTRQRELEDIKNSIALPIAAVIHGLNDEFSSAPPLHVPERLQLLIDDCHFEDGDMTGLSLFIEAKSLYGKVVQRSDDIFKKMKQIAHKDKHVFDHVAENVKLDEEEKRIRRELDQLQVYEKNLREVLSEMKPEADDRVFGAIGEAIYRLHIAILTQKQAEEAAIASLIADAPQEQLNEIEQEIQQAKDRIHGLNQQIVDAQKELFALEEQRRVVEGRKRVAFKQNPSLSNAMETQTACYLRMVMCPICHRNPRNIIIQGCGHSICRKCQAGKDSKVKTCPVCHQCYAPTEARPFILNK